MPKQDGADGKRDGCGKRRIRTTNTTVSTPHFRRSTRCDRSRLRIATIGRYSGSAPSAGSRSPFCVPCLRAKDCGRKRPTSYRLAKVTARSLGCDGFGSFAPRRQRGVCGCKTPPNCVRPAHPNPPSGELGPRQALRVWDRSEYGLRDSSPPPTATALPMSARTLRRSSGSPSAWRHGKNRPPVPAV